MPPIASLARPLTLLTLFAALCGTGCGHSEAHASADAPAGLIGKLTVSGSSTMAPLVAEIAERFESLNQGLRIDVQTGGSSRGIADADSGLADIGMASRVLAPSESARFESVVLARDGVCFIVHAANPVERLSDEQLRAIYSGELSNWRTVGGEDAPITVISRTAGRSELAMLHDYLELQPREVRAHAIAGENQQGIKQVASDPNAICFMSAGTSDFEIARGTRIKALPLRGVAPTSLNVASGSFAWSRPLNFVARESPSPNVRAFLEFATSEAVHDLVREHAFTPAAP